MAIGTFEFFSNCLRRNVTFKIILPNDVDGSNNEHYKRPMKTLYLLHGYCGMCADWIWQSAIVDIAGRYNLCVVLPSGENSFYLDGRETGRQYGTFTGQELVDYARKTFTLSQRREDTFVGGFSMGGFGAIHIGLKYNHTFSKLFAFSSALIVHGIKDMQPGSDNGVANYDYYKMVFGDLAEIESNESNPEELVRRILSRGDVMPEIYMACGGEDYLLKENKRFAAFLTEQKVDVDFKESPGFHNYDFWNQYLEPAVKWLVR